LPSPAAPARQSPGATREGVYHGQCSELCGKDHAFMPIAVRVVSEQAFSTWLDEAKKKYAATGTAPINMAGMQSDPN
jgi:cytochrome c oxidase subunit II